MPLDSYLSIFKKSPTDELGCRRIKRFYTAFDIRYGDSFTFQDYEKKDVRGQ
jgi:hypothetical protein